MSFLAQGKKEDLKALAADLGIEVTSDMTILNMKDLIIKNASHDANFCKSRLTFIVSERKADETLQRDQLEKERNFELEKLMIQAKQSSTIVSLKSSDEINLQRMLPQFEKDGDMALYLTLC
ncbi:hypothetical protein AVEN_175725-1 [Araneus ventricosus]|uniref:Uncharacterized protein n=1 Tax=Araneus ventricosus TaxID=182803 RepID=A0A4Y2UN42_ARAVE|nr:hypothetical protein AVEN_239289-1 [Araneus ventricosus]GBO13652.1 hypothetical protein AVEN_175725-1 [Araneus ventricosus]